MAEKQWHGVSRAEFRWNPVIDYTKCTSCGLCLLSCGSGVFAWSKSKETYLVANPGNCVVGCTTCGRVCPELAISFPDDPTHFVKAAIVKHKIFPAVKKELAARLEKFPDHVVDAPRAGDGGGSNG